MLYVKCRQNINDPSVGEFELERLSGCPREHLEFQHWYLKAKVGSRNSKTGRSQSPWKASIAPIPNKLVKLPPSC